MANSNFLANFLSLKIIPMIWQNQMENCLNAELRRITGKWLQKFQRFSQFSSTVNNIPVDGIFFR
jgi:hypothetical protein